MSRPRLKDWEPEPGRGYLLSDLPVELADALEDFGKAHEEAQQHRRLRQSLKTIPDVLYHYTSMQGLLGILEYGQIWASDAALLNDSLEGVWSHQVASRSAQDHLADVPEFCEFVLPQLGDAASAQPDIWAPEGQALPDGRQWAALHRSLRGSLIACFSNEGDQLGQWRGYAADGTGVAIGFDLSEASAWSIGGERLHFGAPNLLKIEYDHEVQMGVFSEYFKNIRELYENHKFRLNENKAAMPYFIARLYHDIIQFIEQTSWEFKSPAYRDEHEWRLCLSGAVFLASKHRVSGNIIVPYEQLRMPWNTQKGLPIKEIVLGPKCSDLAIRGIRTILNLRSTFPTIKRSTLSYR